MSQIKVANRLVGNEHPTYFIADIAANHDGNLNKAKDLISFAYESGAEAVKFQHFLAEKIVSEEGFKKLPKASHQASWKESVFEVYKKASLPREWTEDLFNYSQKVGIHFFSSPYDFEAVDLLNDIQVPAHKIGSGDITWGDIIDKIGTSGKPVFISTGASEMEEVKRAMSILLEKKAPICLMQCNTNYTTSKENFKYINLNVLNSYKKVWPDVVLGLSDHTAGHTTVLGAVSLGARAIEKHFTDNNKKEGPDHNFSMTPIEWKEMVERTRELELALGSDKKLVNENEKETLVIQRRCLRAAEDLKKGKFIAEKDLIALRPAPLDSIKPYEKNVLVNKKLKKNIKKGDFFSPNHVE